MTDTTATARPGRRAAAKSSGKRKTANRFAKLAGGDGAADIDLSPAAGSIDGAAEDTGLIGGMSAVAADEAHRVVQVPVAEIAPHPFNAAARSQPQPGDPKWEELLNAVRANGVRLPVLVVPRAAFIAARPAATQDIPENARYVLVYGHRRRAAALEAGRDTVPAVVDDTIMADNGDLDAMATENLGRQDLSDLAEADLFARYSEAGLSQRAIAERLGVDQATVSRRLALLLLAPEVRTAVDTGQLPSAEAAAFAGVLPYGPPRRWQKKKDPDQDTQTRRDEQIEALQLVLERGWTAQRAAERVAAAREARAEAETLGVALVEDPRAELGEDYIERRISRDDYRAGMDAVGAINANTGLLDLYSREERPDARPDASAATEERRGSGPAPGPAVDDESDTADDAGEWAHQADSGDDPDPEAAALAEQRRVDAAAAAAAQARRREACAALITHQPSNAELCKTLVRQYLSGVAARSQTSAVRALLRDWDATAEGVGEKARYARAWHHAVAAAELHTAELKDSLWDDDAVAHLEVLIERVGYQPTDWETRQIADARG
ncbi:ParB/RepB/Spo0J family partition protein (plasmid) [Mycolicibacterium vanbaalenii]|uniref:ParB/RepB/Spo0J family partition protein n=1 Tax=Mycolicibacterium vanbaalenii TaxID=110539 RepID=UPI001F298215|nr:ParB/RepB/Spo0J family partition protein [Mycolicibacterium vanbaalenii]UJL32229.1 ParB/RepB/Spo0J family partition protein [Mycolicibacterium vanbaalenii]WND60139.1 ParB/RepB/Spo0J family partition protein [Mycolicibacterium vanbaalenii]